MSDMRSHTSMKMCLIVAAPAAPLQPTAVRMWHFAQTYPALIPQRTLCASGTELGYRYAAPVGAPPQQANTRLAGDPGAGLWPCDGAS